RVLVVMLLSGNVLQPIERAILAPVVVTLIGRFFITVVRVPVVRRRLARAIILLRIGRCRVALRAVVFGRVILVRVVLVGVVARRLIVDRPFLIMVLSRPAARGTPIDRRCRFRIGRRGALRRAAAEISERIVLPDQARELGERITGLPAGMARRSAAARRKRRTRAV